MRVCRPCISKKAFPIGQARQRHGGKTSSNNWIALPLTYIKHKSLSSFSGSTKNSSPLDVFLSSRPGDHIALTLALLQQFLPLRPPCTIKSLPLLQPSDGITTSKCLGNIPSSGDQSQKNYQKATKRTLFFFSKNSKLIDRLSQPHGFLPFNLHS